jgi:uncharacterized protein YndB with AHSA1/START domain
MSKENVARATTAPLQKSITVSCSPADAFELFTNGIARWWPYKQYSVSRERTKTCVLEARADGRIYEVRDDGETFEWGMVLVCEPPHRLLLGWHPGSGHEAAQEVEVRFAAADGGTRVDLEHRDWDKLGDEAASVRGNYEGGWDTVLGKFREAANRRQG